MMICPITQRTYGTTGGWWPCEVAALRSMMRDGYDLQKMAQVLDREYRGVVAKSWALKRKEQTA